MSSIRGRAGRARPCAARRRVSPRDELQRVLETEVLPKFVRVLTNENPDAPPELVEPSASATPVGQSKWLHEHITAMRGAIEAQLTGVFSS